jgi:arginyl-tRNA synthetase
MSQFNQYPVGPCQSAIAQHIYSVLSSLTEEGKSLSLDAVAIARLLEQPPDSTLGDYALPCFRFAKELRLAPPAVAAVLQEKLPTDGWIAAAATAGAFLNIRVNQEMLASATLSRALSDAPLSALQNNESNRSKRVMIEYSQPNTHKEFHVGHGRNVCLGNALVRLFRACGYQVLSTNYYGDEGTHIATVIWHMQQEKLTAPSADRGEWLGQVYVQSKQKLASASDEERARYIKEISEVHRQIENKSGETFALWQETRGWSLASFEDIYRWLGVEFDVIFYESEVSEEAQEIVEEYYKKGVFILDQGAIGVDLKQWKLGFCILRKSDGNTLYATKDLALARQKFDQYKIDRSINVVGAEQIHHFKQVFKVLDLMGFKQAQQCYHLSYGLVVLPEGKMSSRDGTSIPFKRLKSLVSDELSTILTRYKDEWSETEIASTSQKLALGAIKYGMIATDPTKELVFNANDWVSFEGNSGPYLMYSYARVRSILRKGAEQGCYSNMEHCTQLRHPAEHALVRYLYDFPDVVTAACETYRPSTLANHLFQMCQALNSFYGAVSVLKAESPEMISARLALLSAFAATLKSGLDLLGIDVAERM